ncbi:MAG: glycoside hydrolase family 3 C-terminal domain-containing protein, partial [Bifidobacteriaceae bacterium]|nr:glycoside hydrolase family 3 C-terminal domain-containing protein [Bifidobacteriaceae bacterium]
TSDCGAIQDVYTNHHWQPEGYTSQVTRAQAVAWTIKAGTDVDCNGSDYNVVNGYTDTTQGTPGTAVPDGPVFEAIRQGILTENDVNVVLTRAFTVRMRTGEFDTTPWDGYSFANQIAPVVDNEQGPNPEAQDQHQLTAQKASEEGAVLLKNEKADPADAAPILPLDKATQNNIVLLGEFSDTEVHGDYSPTSTYVNDTVEDALNAYLETHTPPGGTLTQHDGVVQPAKPSLGAVGFLGASGTLLSTVALGAPGVMTSTDWNPSGFAMFSPDPSFPYGVDPVNAQPNGSFSITAPIPAGTTRIALSSGGNPPAGGTIPSSFDVSDGATTVASTVLAQGPGSPGSVNIAWGEFNFVIPVTLPNTWSEPVAYSGPADGDSHTLTFTYQNNAATGVVADVLPSLRDAITDADAVIVVAGTTTSDSAEESDRQGSIALPRQQADLINAAAALNQNTIVWLQAVGQVDIEPFKDNVPAIFWSTYNGEYQGRTVPKTIFGDVNPSGKLAFTYYEDPVRDLAVTTDYTMTPTGEAPRGALDNPPQPRLGRTYQYFTGPVTYPFGYGLSYSDFTLSGAALDKTAVTPNDTINVTVDVRNNSTVAGQEVVEVYAISPKAADPLYPDKQLKGFAKVALAGGESKTATVPIKVSDLWFWDAADSAREYEPGAWQLQVGTSSDLGAQGSATGGTTLPFTLSGTLTPALDQVVAVADGTVLNVKAPGSALHANLSATLADQSFIDLAASGVEVAYTSSDPAVAQVDSAGTVTPAGAGSAQITAAVTAYGATKSDTFPVIVYDGSFGATSGSTTTTIQAKQVNLADSTVGLAEASAPAGVQLAASVPGDASAAITYSIAPMDTNTAGAAVTAGGVLTATALGSVRVTALANVGGVYYSHTATVTIGAVGASAVDSKIAEAEAAVADPGGYTASSVAAVTAAVAAARAVLADPAATQAQATAASAAIDAAVAGLAPKGDVAPLAALAAAAEALAADPNLTPASAAALTAAAAAARALAATPNDASAAQVRQASDAITAAFAGAATNPPQQPPASS